MGDAALARQHSQCGHVQRPRHRPSWSRRAVSSHVAASIRRSHTGLVGHAGNKRNPLSSLLRGTRANGLASTTRCRAACRFRYAVQLPVDGIRFRVCHKVSQPTSAGCVGWRGIHCSFGLLQHRGDNGHAARLRPFFETSGRSHGRSSECCQVGASVHCPKAVRQPG